MPSNMGEPHIGEITSGITSTLLERTIEFVYKLLPEWRDDPERPEEDSETRLNLQLCKYLDSRARDAFPMVRFDHEEYQTDRRSVDMSASPVDTTIIDAKQYSIYDPFLVFECKRLPAPSKDREREYVSGGKEKISGGIQRFKTGQHGAELDQAVVIGYIQKRAPKEWRLDVNKWIETLATGTIEDICAWDISETLKLLDEDKSKGLVKFRSVHSRTGSRLSGEIKISHLWIVMYGKCLKANS